MQVVVIGNMMTQEKIAKVVEVEELLKNNPTVRKIVPLREGVMKMFMEVSPDYDWAGEYFEYFVNCLESADRAVFLADGEYPQTKGWLFGYCFAHATPIVVLQDEPVEGYTYDVFVSHSITASVGDMKELESYDFAEANSIFTL